jgi:hypothetical protein
MAAVEIEGADVCTGVLMLFIMFLGWLVTELKKLLGTA